MNQQDRDKLGQALTDAALFFDRPDYDKTKISMLVTVFFRSYSDSSVDSILNALEKYCGDQKNAGFFPSPSRLQPYLRPKVSVESQAQEIAGRIIQAVDRFGYSNAPEAEHFIGEIGWEIVKRFGGWNHLCENLGLGIPQGMFFAQARDLVKAEIEIHAAGRSDDRSLLDFERKDLPALSAPLFDESEKVEISKQLEGKSQSEIDRILQAAARQRYHERQQTQQGPTLASDIIGDLAKKKAEFQK